MRQFRVRLRSFQDVQSFVTLAASQTFPITVGSGDYRVSATSFMGMFTLDYSQPLLAQANCSDEQWICFSREATRFLEI